LRQIGSGAFADCSALTSVNFPDSLRAIGGEAFKRCTALTSVTFPRSLGEIVNDAFGNIDYAVFNGSPEIDSSEYGGEGFGEWRPKKIIAPLGENEILTQIQDTGSYSSQQMSVLMWARMKDECRIPSSIRENVELYLLAMNRFKLPPEMALMIVSYMVLDTPYVLFTLNK
jgi:hypothetical protein